MFDTEYYHKRFAYLRDWFQKGYINNDAATTTTTIGAALTAGKAWTTYVSSKPLVEESLVKDYKKEFVRGFQTQNTAGFSSMTGSMLGIPYTAKHPQQAMQLLNLLYTDEYLLNLLVFGIKDIHYVKGEDNKISLPSGATDLDSTGYNPSITWRIGNQKLNYLSETEPNNKWALYDEFDAQCVQSSLVGFAVDTTSIKLETAAISNVLSEYKSLINTGSVDSEEALAEQNRKLVNNGINKVIAEIETQYRAWKQSN